MLGNDVPVPVPGKWNYRLLVSLTGDDMAALGFERGKDWRDDDVTACLYVLLGREIKAEQRTRARRAIDEENER